MRTFIYLISIFIAFTIHKYVTFSDTNFTSILLIFVALALYAFGTIYLAKSITELLLPYQAEKPASKLTSEERKIIQQKLKDGDSSKYSDKYWIIFTVLVIIFMFGFGSLYFSWLDNWTDQEIKSYRVERKVTIKDISRSRGRYVDFEFEFNNRKYQDRLKDDTLEAGDTISISFSSRNPKILRRNNYR